MVLENYTYDRVLQDERAAHDNAAQNLSRAAWEDLSGFCSKPVQPAKPESTIQTDAVGRITQVDNPDGSTYQYSQFRGNGQPSEIRITDRNTGDWGQWKREEDGLWRSYRQDKPNYEVLRGEWIVDEQGVMRMNGVQDWLDIAKQNSQQPEHRQSAPRDTNRVGPGPNGVPGRPPEGYQPIKGHVSPEVVAEAKSLLGGDWGKETPFEANGIRYMARVEPHYHPPGYQGGPNGWHKGVTVYEAKKNIE